MSRYFTRDQAEKLLPEVDRRIREAVSLKAEYQRAEEMLLNETRRIMMLGGASVDQERFLAMRAVRDTSASGLKEAIEAIHEVGCQVKDLDIGLIDFPTLYRGEEVLLCWKLGEEGIAWWHDTTEGFRGRKPIDDEFLANHRGNLG